MYIFVRAWSSASRSTVRAHLYVLALLDVPTSIAQIAESLRIFGLHSQDLRWSVLLADGHDIVLTSHEEGSLATIWESLWVFRMAVSRSLRRCSRARIADRSDKPRLLEVAMR